MIYYTREAVERKEIIKIMKYAYLRVSTQDKQEFARQEFALKDIPIDKTFEEKISGTKKATARPEFERMVNELQKGDIVYFESMSRMARSMQDLINTTNYLINKIKVKVIFLKENLSIGGEGLDAMGQLVFNIMGAFAQFERDLIADRTSQALQAKKARGEKVSRYDEVSEDKKRDIITLRKQGLTLQSIANKTGYVKSTIYKICNTTTI